MSRSLARRIVRTLREAGHEAWWVGGCVRDQLLGREPEDWDVATSARPDETTALFPRTVPVGASFGVVLVVEESAGGVERVEVASFRKEIGYSDGRRPDRVEFSSAREDVLRRDFTVNGLLMDPETGEVRDWVGGQQDLRDGVLRAVGDPDARFGEDHLRLLRAARIAGCFGFAIETRTREAIRRHAGLLEDVAAERVRDELERILLPETRARGVRTLLDLGLLPVMLPEVDALRGVEQPSAFHPEGDVFEHTLLVLDALRPPAGGRPVSLALALAALLHDAGKPATRTVSDRIRFHGHETAGATLAEEVALRLRLPRDDRERLVWLVRHHRALAHARRMRTANLKRLLAHPGADELLALARADRAGKLRDASDLDWVEARRREWGEAGIAPPPLLRGEDVLALGVPAGPVVGRVLRKVRDAQLDGRVLDRDAAIGLARAIVRGGRDGGC